MVSNFWIILISWCYKCRLLVITDTTKIEIVHASLEEKPCANF